jgi:hypothetical protein
MYIVDEDDVMDLRVAFEESLQYIQEGEFFCILKKKKNLDLTLLCFRDTNSISQFRRPILPH